MKVFKVFLLILMVSNFSFGKDGDRSRFNIECKNGEDAILSDCRKANILSITNPKAIYYSIYVDKEKNTLDKFDILEAKEGLVNINFGFYPPHYDVDYDKTTEFDFIDFKKNNGVFDIHLSRGKWDNLLEPWTADGIAIWMNVIKGISIISETIKAIPKAEEQNKRILKFLQENSEKFIEISNTIKNVKEHAPEFFLALKASSNVIYNISNILNEAGHNPYKKEIDYIYFKTKNICRIGEEVLKITEKDFADMDNDEKIHKIEMELLSNFFEEVDYEDIRKKIFKEANYEDIYNKILSLYIKSKKEKYIYLVLQPKYLEDGFSPKNILTIISAFVTLLDNNKLLEPLLKSTSDTGEYVTKTLIDTLFKSEFGPYYEIPKLANILVPYIWDMVTAPTNLTFHIEKGKIHYIEPPYLKSFKIRNENNEIIYQFPNKEEDLEVTLEPNQCINISYQVHMPDNFERGKEALDQWWTYIYDYEYIRHFKATLKMFFNNKEENIKWDKNLFIKKSKTKYYWKLVNSLNGKKDIREDLNEDELNQIEPIFSKENILYNRKKICFDDNLPTQFRLHYFNFGLESSGGKFVLNIKNKKDNSGFVDISKIDISKKTVKINENFTINFDLKEHNQGSKEFKSIEVWIQKLIAGEWKDQYMAESWKNISFAPDEVKSFSSTTYLSSAYNRTAGDYRAVVRGTIEKDGKEDIFNFGATNNGKSFVAFKAIEGDDLISLTNGLVAHYQFEGNANDSSGNNNHGVEHGGVNYVDGVIGKAGSFDKSYITVQNNNSLKFTKNFTISLWFNTQSNIGMTGLSNIVENNGTQVLLAKSGDRRGFSIKLHIRKDSYTLNKSMQYPLIHNGRCCVNSSYKLAFPTYDDKNYNINGISLKDWHYLTFIYKDGIMFMYIDNKLINKSPKDKFYIDEINTEPILIGIGQSLVWYPYYGFIDDLRIYNRALNKAEIAELYKMGNIEGNDINTNISGKILFEGENNNIQVNSDSYIYKNGKHYIVWSNGLHLADRYQYNEYHNYDNKIKLSTSIDGVNWETKDIFTTKYGSFNHKIAIDENNHIHIVYVETVGTGTYGYSNRNLVYITNKDGHFTQTILEQGSGYSFYSPSKLFFTKDGRLNLFYQKDGWWRYNAPLYERNLINGSWNNKKIVSNLSYGKGDPDDNENMLLDYKIVDNKKILYVSSGYWHLNYHGEVKYSGHIFKYTQDNNSYKKEELPFSGSFFSILNNDIVYTNIEQNKLFFNGNEILNLSGDEKISQIMYNGKVIAINTYIKNMDSTYSHKAYFLSKNGNIISTYKNGYLILTNKIRIFIQNNINPKKIVILTTKNIDNNSEIEKDSDGDGISDKKEEELGLNPNSKDSDGDGVEDGADLYPLDPNKTGQEGENSESDTSYQINDNKLSDLIKKRLKLPSDAVLTKGDLLKVKRLRLKHKRLRSENIRELNKLSNLEILDLSSNKIKDISPLKNLKSLRILNLSKNKIEDISPLEDLTNLTHLKLTSNPIKSNVATLSKLTKLERLFLNKTDIEGDISALSDMQDSKYLILSKTKLRGDIASLENLKKLEYLYLKKLNVEGDISVFEEMTGMRKIYLNNTGVYGDISAFSNMLKVTHIKLRKTKVSGKKSSLKSLPKLKVLDVKRTNVE